MSKFESYRWVNLIIFPIMALLLLSGIVLENIALFRDSEAVMYTYIKSAKQGHVGYGFNVQNDNSISFAGLEPGDIVLGGYPGCAYGRFSHAALYVGDGQVIEGFVDYGVYTNSIQHFHNYTEVALLRVEADPEIKARAVEYAKKYSGRMFYPLAFKEGTRIWNCSKIMWEAYAAQGIDLDPRNDFWIAPDVFYNSPLVSIIREKGR